MMPRFHPGAVRNVPDLFFVIQDTGMWPFSFDLTQEAVAELVSAALTRIALLAGVAIRRLTPIAVDFSRGCPAAGRPANFRPALSLWLCKAFAPLRPALVFSGGIDHIVTTLGSCIVPAQGILALDPLPNGRSWSAAANPNNSSVIPARRSLSVRPATSELE
jgi:hypothetical protein